MAQIFFNYYKGAGEGPGNVQTKKLTYTVTAADVSAGVVAISFPLDFSFTDVNYTVFASVESQLPYIVGSVFAKTRNLVIMLFWKLTALMAGDVITVAVMAVSEHP